MKKEFELYFPELTKGIGCRGAEYNICPEENSCGKYPTKKEALKILNEHF